MIYLDIKIPHLQIAHQGGNLEVGNIKIHPFLKVQLYYNENEYPSNTLCSSFDSSRASKDVRLLRYKLELGLF